MAAIIHLTEGNFEQEVTNFKGTVLVDFYADWCGPCKMMAPVVEKVAEAHPEVKVAKVDVDDQMGLAQKFGVMSIPTLITFKNGVQSEKSVGAISQTQVESML